MADLLDKAFNKNNDKDFAKKKKIGLIALAVVLLLIVGAAYGGKDNNGSESADNSTENAKQVEVGDFSAMKEHEILLWCKDNGLNCNMEREYSDTVEKDGYIRQSVNAGEKVAEGSKVTTYFSKGKAPSKSQENAVRKAEAYLKTSAFSKSGLIDQLKFEGFEDADAKYAVENILVDWEEQAAKKAESYLKISGFSRKGLIDQLKFEGFTDAEAKYGADKVGL